MVVLFFINSSPILWYSKHQATIESSTFGSEVVVMRTCLYLVNELRYKLRMMGVPVDGTVIVLRGEMSVLNGASIP